MSSPHPPVDSPRPRPPRSKGSIIAVVLGVVVLAVGGVIYAKSRGPNRDEALLNARSGKFAAAEPALTELVSRNPDDLDVREALARGYVAAEKYVEAEPHANRLIELRPRNPDFLRIRIKVHKQLAHWEEQYADTNKLVELDPSDENRRAAMDQAFATGRFTEAKDLCLALLKEAPGDKVLRSRLANILRSCGDDAGAAKVLDELIREDSSNYGAKLARGILYDETGNPKEAVKLLRDVFQNDKSRTRTSGYQLAVALGKIGDKDEAERVLAEVRRLQDVEVYGIAMQNQPNNLHLRVRVAETMIKDGHTKDGVELLLEVLKKDPAFGPAHQALADHYEKQGDAASAARHRRQAGSGK